MPTSYQAPMRQDKDTKRTQSQSQATNMQAGNAVVGDVLKGKGQDVFGIRPNETLGTAVEILKEKGIGALLVTDQNGKLCGILSERDIVRKLADTPGHTLPKKVEEVMTSKVETTTPDEDLVSVLKRMTAGRFRHMPVMEGDKLIGMVTIGDAINHRLSQLEYEAVQLKQLIVG